MKITTCIASRLVLLLYIASAFGQTPYITNVTNSAYPSLDNPPATLTLPSRSMASIFGTNLADSTASSQTWTTTLGNTEVHLAGNNCFDPSCDLIAKLIYASPTQITFLIPDDRDVELNGNSGYRVVLIRNGQRIDDRSYMMGGPGFIVIDETAGDSDVVFQVGYDCLFSYSLADPASCGLSWTQGQHRAALGAVTDAVSGQLITSQAPVHQGQVISIWATGLLFGGDLVLNARTGLMEEPPRPLNFGVAQLGNDVSQTMNFSSDGLYWQFGVFETGNPLWAGEPSPLAGLDQINVAFPICNSTSVATVEKRYDAFMQYSGNSFYAYTNKARIYLPFLVRIGDPDCQSSGFFVHPPTK